jgi:NADH-quinone oxidoreductase subunit J
MTFVYILFILSALLVVVSTLLTIITTHLIHSCVYLLGALLGMAGIYVTLGADYVAAIQILVYVGGVVMLMLFAVMLTGGQDFIKWGRTLHHLVPPMGSKKTAIIALLTSAVFCGSLIQMTKNIMEKVGEVGTLGESTVEKIGVLLVTDYVLAFEMISVLLLGALVGAAVIARPRKDEPHKLS